MSLSSPRQPNLILVVPVILALVGMSMTQSEDG
jgi:hypothetical protein